MNTLCLVRQRTRGARVYVYPSNPSACIYTHTRRCRHKGHSYVCMCVCTCARTLPDLCVWDYMSASVWLRARRSFVRVYSQIMTTFTALRPIGERPTCTFSSLFRRCVCAVHKGLSVQRRARGPGCSTHETYDAIFGNFPYLVLVVKKKSRF